MSFPLLNYLILERRLTFFSRLCFSIIFSWSKEILRGIIYTCLVCGCGQIEADIYPRCWALSFKITVWSCATWPAKNSLRGNSNLGGEGGELIVRSHAKREEAQGVMGKRKGGRSSPFRVPVSSDPGLGKFTIWSPSSLPSLDYEKSPIFPQG